MKYHQLNIHICTLCQNWIYVFCVYLRTNSDLSNLHHELIGFITENKSVYCAVRTGYLNKAASTWSLKGLRLKWDGEFLNYY